MRWAINIFAIIVILVASGFIYSTALAIVDASFTEDITTADFAPIVSGVRTGGFSVTFDFSQEPKSLADYDELITQLEQSLELFKEERAELKRQQEQKIYVSVFSLHKARDQIHHCFWHSIETGECTTEHFCKQDLQKIIDKAKEIDPPIMKSRISHLESTDDGEIYWLE